jgi:transcriptional regulator with XRE-family HTH domain
MPQIGEKLREARMRQGLDIADVEERTKIRAKYLRALENEEWGLLPGHTFVKTFLRTYAEQVGIDPHVLVEDYRLSHEAEEPDMAPLASTPAARRDPRTRDRRRTAPDGPPRRGAILALAAVALVAFLLVLGMFGEDDPPDQPASTDATGTASTPTKRPPARRKPAPPGGVAMRVTPTFPTYTCVDSGEGTDVIYEGTLEEARTFRSPDLLRINLGKRSVEVQVNGEPVEIEDTPEPIGLEATRDGAEEIVEEMRPCA